MFIMAERSPELCCKQCGILDFQRAPSSKLKKGQLIRAFESRGLPVIGCDLQQGHIWNQRIWKRFVKLNFHGDVLTKDIAQLWQAFGRPALNMIKIKNISCTISVRFGSHQISIDSPFLFYLIEMRYQDTINLGKGYCGTEVWPECLGQWLRQFLWHFCHWETGNRGEIGFQ